MALSATFTVASNGDGCPVTLPGTLRAAIEAANATPGPDDIVFSPSFYATPGPIILCDCFPPLNDSTTINAGFSGLVQIDAGGLAGSCNIFESTAGGAQISIHQVQIDGDNSTVQPIYGVNLSRLQLIDVEIFGFNGPDHVVETVNSVENLLERTTVRNNITENTPVDLVGALTYVVNSAFSGNQATDVNDPLTNQVNGGALSISGFGTPSDRAEIVGSDFVDHEGDNGGALWTNVELTVASTSFRNNLAYLRGGAIDASGPAVRMSNGYLADSEAPLGGAIWSDGDLAIAFGTLKDNTVTNPGSSVLVGEDIRIGAAVISNGLNTGCATLLSGTINTSDTIATDDSAASGTTNTCVPAGSANSLFTTAAAIDFETMESFAPGVAQNAVMTVKPGSVAIDHVSKSGGSCVTLGVVFASDDLARARPGSGDCDAGAWESN